jgi:hypothetical protein
MKLITFFASWMPNTESAVQPANSVVPLFMEPFARDKAVSECSVDPYCFLERPYSGMVPSVSSIYEH